ncbi:MAG: hypothetical protein RL563_225 [Pseudomonadota bacterium]
MRNHNKALFALVVDVAPDCRSPEPGMARVFHLLVCWTPAIPLETNDRQTNAAHYSSHKTHVGYAPRTGGLFLRIGRQKVRNAYPSVPGMG